MSNMCSVYPSPSFLPQPPLHQSQPEKPSGTGTFFPGPDSSGYFRFGGVGGNLDPHREKVSSIALQVKTHHLLPEEITWGSDARVEIEGGSIDTCTAGKKYFVHTSHFSNLKSAPTRLHPCKWFWIHPWRRRCRVPWIF